MQTHAVVLTAPEHLAVQRVDLTPPGEADVVVDIAWSGISTGTERLLYTGTMPPFPGMGYPLVPGYESVGRVAQAGAAAGLAEGQLVFVPGANCYGEIRGLFGGTAARVVTGAQRVVPVPEALGESASLLALAATAQHALNLPGAGPPDLIVGHGTVGRLLARLAVAAGAAPTVWETNPARADGAQGYSVTNATDDTRRNYRCIIDASGSAAILDTLIARLAPGGAVVLAGFYDTLSFAFPPAFMREARILIAAQFTPSDTTQVLRLVEEGRVSLDGLITHRLPASDAPAAYRTAFSDTSCLKMVLDWRNFA
jgi:3-hydroxyethyl bacteriochlorophyllide a dehydrogenase